MPFTQLFQDTFARAASSSLGNGWLDPGSEGSILSSGLAQISNPASGWTGNGMVYRPASDGNPRDGQVTVVMPAGQPTDSLYICLRLQYAAGTSTCYVVGVNFGASVIKANPVTSGSLNSTISGSSVNFSPAYNSADGYTMTASAVGVNPTTISATLTDNVTQAVVATFTVTDSTAALQSPTSGQFGIFTNGAPITLNSFTSYSYSANATTYTLTGPSSGTVGVASSAFTVTPSGTAASNIVVTPSDGGNGGTFSPSTVTFSSGSSAAQTFTYTAASTGAKTISTTNNGSLTDPSSLNYTSNAANATSYSLTGPSSGTVSVASGSFTVTPNGAASGSVVVTPSDGANGGTFTPSAVTFASGSSASQTFTYTAASAGAKTISATNNGGLTNPSSLTYTATNPATVTLGVTSPAVLFSPGNWKGDTGRGGSVYRQSWNNGAWVSFTWNASASPTAQLLITSSSASNLVSYFLNDILTDNVAANGNITLSGLKASQVNTLRVYLRNSTQSSRWNNGTNTVQITGLQVDGGSSAGTAPATRPWAMIIGDSITEGIQANGGNDDTLYAYSFLVSRALDQLGYDTCVSACGYSGWLTAGDSSGDVPGYYVVSGSSGGVGGTYSATSRWNKIDSGVSLLDSNNQISAYGATGTAPAIIYINYGTNEEIYAANLSDTQASVNQAITALRAAAPAALIVIQVPFGLYYSSIFASGPAFVAAIKAGVAAYQAAYSSDSKVVLSDFGSDLAATISHSPYTGGTVHPWAPGHALLTGMVTAKIVAGLASVSATPAPLFRSGFPTY